jgi:hypothetical protein
MEMVEFFKYSALVISCLFCFYVLMRLGSSAVFRSYFEQKFHHKVKKNREDTKNEDER